MGIIKTLLNLFIVFPLIAYRYLISPVLGNHCRFYPTCSSYGIEAVRQYGLVGIFLTIKRLSRCHAFHAGGFDPVEENIRKL